jgi:hypothetical protein
LIWENDNPVVPMNLLKSRMERCMNTSDHSRITSVNSLEGDIINILE